VAAHIDVTERALQMAFRKHLGLTPAELIRRHRMEGIRNDLRDSTGAGNVLKTAERWGMSNRSTLAHGYRQLFSETPTGTLRG
jgi:transcriptional regulator GlxA family with amidase domain